jgi:hypothetical protein
MPPKRKQISDSESDDFNSSDSPPVKIRSKVSNVRAKQKKKPERRIKHSNFIFTINTNQRIGPYDERLEEFCDSLKDCMSDIFSNLHDYVKILEPDHEWSREYIKKAECDSVVERGEKFDQIHCHCFIGISHYSKLQLDRKEIHDRICSDLDLKKCQH